MPAPTPWQALVRLINDGTPVDASTTNKPLYDLAQRDQYLKDLLDALGASEALYFRNAALKPEVKVGQAVYLDKTAGNYGQALAEVSFDIHGNWGVVSDRAFVWGVVARKASSTVGDIVTFGVIRGVDLSLGIEDVDVSGPRYLSGATPGMLVIQKPAVSNYILYWDAARQIALVTPTPKDSLEGHIHYKFSLVPEPAGIPNNPAYGENQEIVTPDPLRQGWLPADHPSFGGMAPPGAKFGYNLAKDENLATVFPPIPIDSYYLEVYGEGWGTGREPAEAIKIDNNGIWWMRNDWGWAPWSTDYWRLSSSSVALTPGTPSELPPPVDQITGHGYSPDGQTYALSIYLWFTRMTFKTDAAIVASLSACPGSPIKVLDCNCGVPASTGHLKLALDLAFTEGVDPHAGAWVFKGVDGLDLQGGYVVETIKSNSPNIVVTGTEAYGFDPLLGYKQRTITLDFVNPITNDRELDVALVALDNAREDSVYDVFFIGYPNGRDASIRGRLDIPALAFPDTTNVKLHFRIIGTAAGIMPSLSLSYRRISKTTTVPYILPTSDTTLPNIDLSLVNGGSPILANSVVEVDSALFTVASGDTVYFTVRRNGTLPADTYAGSVGIIRQKGVVTA